MPGLTRNTLTLSKATPEALAEYQTIWILKVDPATAIRSEPAVNLVPCHARVAEIEHTKTYRWEIQPSYEGRLCHAQQGNSGSPILTNDGEFVGVFAQGLVDGAKSNMYANDLSASVFWGAVLSTIQAVVRELQ
jgi:hypothetical protein